MQLEFRVVDEEIFFDSAEASQEFAKKNPGKVVVRNNGFSKKQSSSKRKKQLINITPKIILNHLNKHIIAQDNAKKEIAMTLYYHYAKSIYPNHQSLKTNDAVMLVGPTGSGKTFVIQKACEFINSIFIHVDTSSMVPEGIVGYSIGDLGRDILKLANYNINSASHCVVFFDEVDKLFSVDSEHGDKVASQLLRLIEGTKIKIPHASTGLSEKELDTTNMQFIFGGAFQWILDEKKSKKNSTMGFSNSQNSKENTGDDITLDDLYEEDIPKELLGRMSSIINLKKLTTDDYYHILTKCESSPLNEFIKKIEFHGDKVAINDETLYEVAKQASQSELGTRAIKQILKKMFREPLFSAPDERASKTYQITFI